MLTTADLGQCPTVRYLTLILSLAVACGGQASPAATEAPPAPVPDNLTGLISEIRYEGDKMSAFVVETRKDSYDLLIDPGFDYGFNLKHLEKHKAQSLPVTVEVVTREGMAYAHDIFDA